LATAAAATAVLVWFLNSAWCPALELALGNLPEHSSLTNGRLVWGGEPVVHLADHAFFSIAVDLEGNAEIDQSADVQVEFGPAELRVRSMFGFVTVPYPPDLNLRMDRQDVLPWWGAWRPIILGGVALLSLVCLLSAWFLIASILALPVRLYAFLLDRKTTVGECWRLAFGSHLLGACLVTLALALYGLSRLSLASLLLSWFLHWFIISLLLITAPLRLPKFNSGRPGAINPFAPPDP
jgi:hypothetical protein